MPETTLLSLRPTRLIAFRYYVAMVVLWVGAALTFIDPLALIPDFRIPFLGILLQSFLAGLLGFLGLLSLLYAEIRRIMIRYLITDSRIVRQEGIVRRKTNQMPFSKLERMQLDQGILQRILKYGDIVIDTGDDYLVLESIGHVNLVQEELSKIVATYSRRGGGSLV